MRGGVTEVPFVHEGLPSTMYLGNSLGHSRKEHFRGTSTSERITADRLHFPIGQSNPTAHTSQPTIVDLRGERGIWRITSRNEER